MVERRVPDSDATRLRVLIDAGIFVSGELRLDAVLERIAQTACDVIGARYGAIGVIDPQGTGLSNFVFKGLTEADRERIGHLPVGRGLLGALITDPKPVRLKDLAQDPRSVGFPEGHPPMRSFLGVPIRARGKVFGNLYLTEKEGDAEFTEEDEWMAGVLAGQAGVAVENARLYEQARENEEVSTQRLLELELVQDIGAALLEELDPDRVLRMIVLRARELVAADSAILALNEGGSSDLLVRVAAGDRAGTLEGFRMSASDPLSGFVLRTLGPAIVPDASQDQRAFGPLLEAARSRSAVVAPLVEHGRGIGVLGVLRREADAFGEDDLFVVKRFAALASLALRNARTVAAERERAFVEAELAEANIRRELQAQTLRAVIRAQEEERRRIARELHDTAGQSLASILLGLKLVRDEKAPDQAQERLASLREMTAEAAGEVRRIALELRPTALDDLGLSAALGRYTQDVQDRTGIEVTSDVEFEDRLPPEVETVLYRVAQESITNAVKYADPKRISLGLVARDGRIVLGVSDDGKGFDPRAAQGLGLGLLGMHERAQLIGGRLTIDSSPGRGTTVTLELDREPK